MEADIAASCKAGRRAAHALPPVDGGTMRAMWSPAAAPPDEEERWPGRPRAARLADRAPRSAPTTCWMVLVGTRVACTTAPGRQEQMGRSLVPLGQALDLDDRRHLGGRALDSWLVVVADELASRPRDGLGRQWWPWRRRRRDSRSRSPSSASTRRWCLCRGQVIVGAMPHPVVCFGSASLYLGLLATATAQWAAAIDRFEAAIRPMSGWRPDRCWPAPAMTRPDAAGPRPAGDRQPGARAAGPGARHRQVGDGRRGRRGIRTLQATQAGEPMPAEPAAAEAGRVRSRKEPVPPRRGVLDDPL